MCAHTLKIDISQIVNDFVKKCVFKSLKWEINKYILNEDSAVWLKKNY